METKSTLLKSSLLALLLFISTTAFSATYYVCSGSTINFTPPAPAAGITYKWDVQQGGTSIGAGFIAITPTSGVYSITAPTTAGTYQIILRSESSNPAVCAPADATNDFNVLPPLSITLAAPSNPSYCGAATTPSSVITPTLGGFPTGTPYSTDLEAEYSYSVVFNGGAPVNGTTVGSINATTGAFTLTATAVGSYVITGTVKYKQKVGFANELKSASGCPTTSTTQTVTVTTAPAQPAITISAS